MSWTTHLGLAGMGRIKPEDAEDILFTACFKTQSCAGQVTPGLS